MIRRADWWANGPMDVFNGSKWLRQMDAILRFNGHVREQSELFDNSSNGWGGQVMMVNKCFALGIPQEEWTAKNISRICVKTCVECDYVIMWLYIISHICVHVKDCEKREIEYFIYHFFTKLRPFWIYSNVCCGSVYSTLMTLGYLKKTWSYLLFFLQNIFQTTLYTSPIIAIKIP